MLPKPKMTEPEKAGGKKGIRRVLITAGSIIGVSALCFFAFPASLLLKEAPQIRTEQEVVQVLDQSEMHYISEEDGGILFSNPSSTMFLEIIPSELLESETLADQITSNVFTQLEAQFNELNANASSSSLELSHQNYRHLKMGSSEEFLILVRNNGVIFRMSGAAEEKASAEQLLRNIGALA